MLWHLIPWTLEPMSSLVGRYVEAEAMLRRSPTIAPEFTGEHFWLGMVILMQGRLQDALAEVPVSFCCHVA